MSYEIVFSEEASEQFSRLPSHIKRKVVEKIDALAENPIPHNAKKMQGYETIYRIRFSDWRVVYDVQETEILVEVLRVGNRKDVYKRDLR
jgi:mRNA interferase RelE/StbE